MLETTSYTHKSLCQRGVEISPQLESQPDIQYLLDFPKADVKTFSFCLTAVLIPGKSINLFGFVICKIYIRQLI